MSREQERHYLGCAVWEDREAECTCSGSLADDKTVSINSLYALLFMAMKRSVHMSVYTDDAMRGLSTELVREIHDMLEKGTR